MNFEGVFLPLMMKTRSKPAMVVSAEVVVVIIIVVMLSIVTILVDSLRHTS